MLKIIFIFLIILALTRFVSLASICAAVVLPFAVLFFELNSDQTSSTIIVFVTLLCGWVIFKHRTNIARLRDGTEGKILDGNENPVTPPSPSDNQENSP